MEAGYKNICNMIFAYLFEWFYFVSHLANQKLFVECHLIEERMPSNVYWNMFLRKFSYYLILWAT